jgi:hypothetical protein
MTQPKADLLQGTLDLLIFKPKPRGAARLRHYPAHPAVV